MSDRPQRGQCHALTSIHPHYALAILRGKKTVELRRRPFPETVRVIAVYATAPISLVLGTVEVTAVKRLPSSTAWREYGRRAAIRVDAFDKYFAGAPEASVIELRNPVAFETQVRLSDLRADLRAPMSWKYLSAEDWAILSHIAAR